MISKINCTFVYDTYIVTVAQQVKASDCGSDYQGFESLMSH